MMSGSNKYYPMLGFKKFSHATVTLTGIELAAKIKKSRMLHQLYPTRNRNSTNLDSGACRVNREK
jgi:hypothetical protein